MSPDRKTCQVNCECFPSPPHSFFPSMSTEASNENEKSPSPSPNGRFSWLKPKQSEKRDSASFVSNGEPVSVEVRVAAPVEENLKPVSFFGLFRSVCPCRFSPAFFTLAQVFHSHGDHRQQPCSCCRSSRRRRSGLCLTVFLSPMLPFPTNGYFCSPS